MKNFIQESWNEYISFFKDSFKNKSKRKWLILLIATMEVGLLIVTFYFGYKIFKG